MIAAAVAGCTGPHLKDEPPAGVSLAGNWKLDPQLSTDARKALKQLIPPPPHSARRSPDSVEGILAGDTGDEGPPSSGAGGGRRNAQFGGGGTSEFTPDIQLQQSLLSGGDFLRVEQRPNEFVMSDGETTRSFVPGEKSVVSVPTGVADQSTGWKGNEYWIEIKPQVGPKVTEKLRHSDKGDQLIETIDVASEGRVRPLHVIRVYNPTQGGAPIVLPGEN